MNLKGTVIAFEGPDGVGKSTISKILYGRLIELGYEVESYSFPGRGCSDLGTLVYDFHHRAVQGAASVDRISLQILHAAAHIDLINNKIYPAVKSGRCVILDRFWWSLVAYGLHDNVPPNVLTCIMQLEQIFLEKIEPAIVFLLERDVQQQDYSALMQQYLRIYDEQKQNDNAFVILNDSLSKTLQAIETTLINL